MCSYGVVPGHMCEPLQGTGISKLPGGCRVEGTRGVPSRGDFRVRVFESSPKNAVEIFRDSSENLPGISRENLPRNAGISRPLLCPATTRHISVLPRGRLQLRHPRFVPTYSGNFSERIFREMRENLPTFLGIISRRIPGNFSGISSRNLPKIFGYFSRKTRARVPEKRFRVSNLRIIYFNYVH